MKEILNVFLLLVNSPTQKKDHRQKLIKKNYLSHIT